MFFYIGFGKHGASLRHEVGEVAYLKHTCVFPSMYITRKEATGEGTEYLRLCFRSVTSEEVSEGCGGSIDTAGKKEGHCGGRSASPAR